MPVHRLGWDAKARTWFEWGVTLRGGRFVWTRMLTKLRGNSDQPQSESRSLDIPVCDCQLQPHDCWMCCRTDSRSRFVRRRRSGGARRRACLECGKLVTIDYGLTADELLRAREKGRHRCEGIVVISRADDVLADPGEQDITAHVNFTAIRDGGESAGLQTEVLPDAGAVPDQRLRRGSGRMKRLIR